MLLKNTAPRLITINAPAVKAENGRKMKAKAYQIKPGKNPSVEVPDELCKNAFVEGLIESGDLQVIESTSTETIVDDETTNEYDGMEKPDVKLVAESLGIDVKSSWSKTKIIQEIVKLESE